MSPHDESIANLALYAPKLALGMVLGVPRVPTVLDIPIQFSSSTVNAPPVVQNFQNNLTQDTIVERVSFQLFQQNSFAGSPLQSLYFSQLKLGMTGVGVQMAVYGSPKYNVNDTFTDLGNLLDILAITWPNGWPLPKQCNVKVSAILTQTPVSVPFNITLTFLGWQLLESAISDLSDAEARAKLRALGIVSPDLSVLLSK